MMYLCNTRIGGISKDTTQQGEEVVKLFGSIYGGKDQAGNAQYCGWNISLYGDSIKAATKEDGTLKYAKGDVINIKAGTWDIATWKGNNGEQNASLKLSFTQIGFVMSSQAFEDAAEKPASSIQITSVRVGGTHAGTTQSGTEYLGLYGSSYVGKKNEQSVYASWKFTAFNGSCKFLKDKQGNCRFGKGDTVNIYAPMAVIETYDKDGATRANLVLLFADVESCGKGEGSGSGSPAPAGNTVSSSSSSGASGFMIPEDIDDELPFA